MKNLIHYLDMLKAENEKGITFLRSANEKDFLSYSELATESSNVAGNLLSCFVRPGDEVILLIQDPKKFIIAFWACIKAGIVPIPVALDSKPESIRKFIKIFNFLNHPFVISDGADVKAIYELVEDDSRAIGEYLNKIILFNSVDHFSNFERKADITCDDLAYVQFSSGSTSEPKGVTLTHRNIIVNALDIIESSETAASDTALCWMPLTHDMGLIGFHITSLIAGIDQYIIPTSLFIKRPVLWLEAASIYRITQLYTPNYGLYYFLSFFPEPPAFVLDLSCVRIIYNGAEFISKILCNRFVEKLKPYGLNERCLLPVYGLAEASVAVSIPKVGNEVQSYFVNRHMLQIGSAVEFCMDGHPDGTSFVAEGYPLRHCTIRITDNDGSTLTGRHVGNIEIKGENVTKGYYKNNQQTALTITKDGWLKTGDLGFIHDDMLVVTGRKKNIVIVNGRNYYYHDIENMLVEFAGLQLGKVVAAGTRNPVNEKEELIVFTVHKGSLQGFAKIIIRINKILEQHLGISADEVVPVKKIPKTTSGKIQHYKLIEDYRNGSYDPVISSLRAEAVEMSKASFSGKDIEGALMAMIGQEFSKQITPEDDLWQIGLNSIHAIKLTALLSDAFDCNLSMADIYHNATIRALTNRIQAIQNKREGIKYSGVKANVNGYYNVSRTQKRFYVLNEDPLFVKALTICWTYKLNGPLHMEAICDAVQKLVKKYDILRAGFCIDNGEVRMFIRNGSLLPQFEITDWCNEAEKSERLHELLASEAGLKFDLEKDILFRFHCVKFSVNESFLCFTGHHIILDGWSLSVIAENISLFYNNYINNSNIPVAAPGLQFTDYVQWHEDILAGNEGKASLEYWQKEAGNAEFAVELPFDKRLCSKETIGFNKITLHLGPELSELVASFSKDQKVTRFNIMISVLYLLLSRYTGKREIIIGTNLAGRWDRKWIDQVGLFSNTIPLKCEIALADTFHSLLQKVVSKMEKAFLHQKIPFELLAHVNDAPALQKEQSICNVLYIDQDYNNAFDLKLPGIGCSLYESNEVNVNGFADLQFETIRNGSAISIELKYRRQVVPDLVAKALPLHFKNLLAEVVKDPLKCIPAYVYTEKNELHGVQQLSLFNKPADNDNVTVTGLFKKAAGIHAHSTAVICGERSLSYKELDRLSTQLCNYLLNNHRINDNRLIGIMMRRSERSIITILGILKAGCAFVPLDPEWPKDRKRIVLEDCRPSVLITDGENYTGSEQMADVAAIIDYDAIDLADHFLPGNVVNGRDQRDGNAYVIYTSGTTGIPKGVLISNGALANYVKTCSAYFSISSTDRVLHQSSLGFDIAIEEIFPILCAGGVLVVSERRNSDVAYAVDLISDHLITIVSTTPSIINYYNQNAHRVKGLRLLISGGEELIPENIDRLMGQVPIYNTYGPTESTVCVTYNLVSAIEQTKVIGKPIDNTGVYILNEQLMPVPPGVIGEIFIGGRNLAKGYLNNPELTAEKFIPDPVAGKGLLYRTGDLAYWLPAGEIVFTGRKDSQVKILGYRIELSDIENCLMQHHCITCAKVIVKEAANKQKQLVAFYSCKENGSNNIDLRTWLLEKLPYQMVPHHFVQVDSFPLNSSGKINIASLAENYLHHEEHRNIPVNRVDRKLAELWKEVLQLPVIYASDNFFEAGGNSITGIALVAAVNRTFNTGYDIRHLFENPTLEAFAVLLDQRTAGILPAPSLAPEAPLYDLSMAQHGLWLLHQFEKGLVAFNIFGVFQLTGPLELPALQQAFDAVIKRHSILRVSIITVDGSPKQIIDNEHSFTIKVADLRDRSDKESALKKAIAEESAREFDPGQSPLLRATVLLFDDNAAFLLFSMQHLISDGDSCLILAKEVFACYSYIIKNKTALQLPPLALQYKDFVFWQQQYLLSDKAVEDGLFWKHYLQGVASMCSLPFDSRPTTTRSYAGNTIDLKLPEADVDLLVKAHKQHAVSFYVLILSVTKLLLNKLTFHNDISLVSPWSGRLHPDFNPLIGLFVNPLIIRSEIDENDTIAGFIQATNRNFMAILRHKEYPFEKVVMALNENEGNNKGRFNVRLLWDESELPVNGFDNEIAITNELSLNQIRYYPEFSLHDLSFIFSKRQGIHVALQYNSDLFHKSTIELVMLRLLKLISTVVNNPNLTIREIDLRLPFEIERDNKINALFTKSELF